jgi:HSP20 family protein
MALREIVPWKWGGLREWEPEARPFRAFRQQMEALHRDMDRLFEEMWGEGPRTSLLPQVLGGERVLPYIDETEDEKAFHVSIELPGMDEKDVDITLSGRVLTIRGEKKQEEEQKEKDYYRRERTYGAFRRTIELPGEVDSSKIEASFKKGVLRVALPKTKEAQEKVKHISVKAA